MARTRTAWPTQKITASTLSGALVAVFVWIMQYYAHTDIPAQVAGMLVILVSAVVGYFTPPGDDETVPTGASVTMEHVDVAHVDTTEVEHL